MLCQYNLLVDQRNLDTTDNRGMSCVQSARFPELKEMIIKIYSFAVTTLNNSTIGTSYVFGKMIICTHFRLENI